MTEPKPYTFDRVVRILFSGAVLCALIWLLNYLSDVLTPFAIAVLLAYLLNPLVLWVQKKIKKRPLAVLVSLAGVVVVTVLLASLVIPMIMNEIAHMGQVVAKVINNAALAERAERLLPAGLWQAIQDYLARDEVQDFFRSKDFWQIIANVARKVLPGAWGLIAGTASFLLGLIGLIVIVLYLVFVLMDYERISQGWKGLLPPAYGGPFTEFVSEFETAMKRYFRGQALVSAIGAVVLCIGFTLIGLPMGILLGLLMGLLNMVPYLQTLGIVPAFLLTLFHTLETGGSIWLDLGLTAVVLVVAQIIQDWIFAPRIIGKVTGMSPALILLSLTIWAKLLGFLGLIIALPMTCLVVAYYRRFLARMHSNAENKRT